VNVIARSNETLGKQHRLERSRELAPCFPWCQHQLISLARSRHDSRVPRSRRDSIYSGSALADSSRNEDQRPQSKSSRDGAYTTDRRRGNDSSTANNEYSESRRQERKNYDPEDGNGNYNTYIPDPKTQDFASTSRPSVDSLAQGVAKLDLSTADNYKGPYTQAGRFPTASITTTESSAYATYTDPTSTGYPAGTYAPPQQYESKSTTTGQAVYGLSSATTSDPAGQDPVDINQELNSRHIAGTPQRGDTERLDKSYVIRNRDYQTWFKIGRVFSTLWTDGLGGSSTKVDPTFVSEVVYGERVHSKIRRFVVIRQSTTSVSCLPVTSYDGAGHLKRGINLKEHGFIYSRNKPGRVPGMRQKALKVKLSKGAATLKDPSLVNYGKVYTVETNVKVKDVGVLDKDSEEVLLYYFHKVFNGIDGTLQQPDLTPKARAADLAYVGGATSSYQTSPQPGPYLPPAISNVSSYPPTNAYISTPNSSNAVSYGGYAGSGYNLPPTGPSGYEGSFSNSTVPSRTGFQTPMTDNRYLSDPSYQSNTYASAPGYPPYQPTYQKMDIQYSTPAVTSPTAYNTTYSTLPRAAQSTSYRVQNEYPPAPAQGQYSQQPNYGRASTRYDESEDIDLDEVEREEYERQLQNKSGRRPR
jgi:hypothetical protein